MFSKHLEEQLPTIEQAMRVIFVGMGNGWIGYKNGSVVCENNTLNIPQIGTSTADFELLPMDRYYPNNDVFVVYYFNLKIFVILIGKEYSNPVLATTRARANIVNDFNQNKILLRDL